MTSSFSAIASGLGLTGDSKVGFVRVYGDAGGNQNLTNLALGAYYGTVDQWDKRDCLALGRCAAR